MQIKLRYRNIGWTSDSHHDLGALVINRNPVIPMVSDLQNLTAQLPQIGEEVMQKLGRQRGAATSDIDGHDA
jgi:hypothetical protein